MKEYKVVMTDSALRDMDDLYQYIAIKIKAPQNAIDQYNRIADAVLKLNRMPERFKVFTVEPWLSRGLHRMNVDNYAVFYYIHTDTVIITNVLYAASDLEIRLRGELFMDTNKKNNESEIKARVTKIIIKGASGFFYSRAYEDKVEITPHYISYEYFPKFESEIDEHRSWKYETNSPMFKSVYEKIVENLQPVHSKIERMVEDGGQITFEVTYSDGSKWEKTFWGSEDDFSELFNEIKILVPDTELAPAVLWTNDDDETDDYVKIEDEYEIADDKLEDGYEPDDETDGDDGTGDK
jgi:toxin ParE1/3/4